LIRAETEHNPRLRYVGAGPAVLRRTKIPGHITGVSFFTACYSDGTTDHDDDQKRSWHKVSKTRMNLLRSCTFLHASSGQAGCETESQGFYSWAVVCRLSVCMCWLGCVFRAEVLWVEDKDSSQAKPLSQSPRMRSTQILNGATKHTVHARSRVLSRKG
jgi:hypothetical protein